MRFVRLVGLAVLAAAVAALLPASNSRAAALAVAADDRQPIPTDAEIMKALATIKDTYKTEYAKTKVADRAALAQKLFQLARETKDDPIGRYVLLLEARDLGAKGADGLTAMAAADELAADYRVKQGEVRAAIADVLSATANSPTASLTASQVLLGGAASSRQYDDWDSTIILLRAANVSARKAGANRLADTAAARLKEAEAMKAEANKIPGLLETLKTKPDDPDANLAVGRYTAAGKDDFDEGVKYLAKCGDAKLKDAAAKDIKAKEGGEAEQIAAGDAWYDLAAGAEPLFKPAYQTRAYHWYVEVLGEANGLNKAKAEKRISELQAVAESRADRNALFVGIRKAVAEKQYKKWQIVGGAFGNKEFSEIPTEGGYLIGFYYTTVNKGNNPGDVQPIWMTARGERIGTAYGTVDKRDSPIQLTKAKPGYAIGAIYTRGGGGFDAFKPIYMRITRKGLDVNDKYDGPYIGGKGGGDGTVGGDGNFIIGLHGKANDKGHIYALSVVSMTDRVVPKKKP
jgi:hypothetical protein